MGQIQISSRVSNIFINFNLNFISGADLNLGDVSGRTILHRFLALRYSGGANPGQLLWRKFKYLQG